MAWIVGFTFRLDLAAAGYEFLAALLTAAAAVPADSASLRL
jgi:hypothetical protein